MIRNNVYAYYNGKDYEIIKTIKDGEKVIELRSQDAEDLKIGFYVYKRPDSFTGLDGNVYYFEKKNDSESKIYLRRVEKSDVPEVFSIHTFGIYKGHESPIEGENETQYFLRADNWNDWVQKLGFIWRDRDDIIKDVDKSEVDPVYERKTLLPDFFD